MRKKDEQFSIEDCPEASPLAKAERLKRVRLLANLSREEFCSENTINVSTLISWELGRFGGLSKKGAEQVINRVAKEGVFLTKEWLLYEVGSSPEVKTDFKKNKENFYVDNKSSLCSDNTIIEELLFFKKLNPNSIDCIINDESMSPFYGVGDYVAGIKRFGEDIRSLVGCNCIVQTKNGAIYVRRLHQGPRDNSYNMLPCNLDAYSINSVIHDLELLTAAPIVWHRRKEPI